MQQPSPHTLGLQPPGPSALAPSGKMVSLDLLLGSPPATPRDGPLLQVPPPVVAAAVACTYTPLSGCLCSLAICSMQHDRNPTSHSCVWVLCR